MQNLPEAQAILSGMTVKELREIAREIHKAANDVKIPGYTKMPKAELVRMLSFEDAWMFAEMRINRMNDDADEREMNEIRAEIAEEAAYIEEGIEIDERAAQADAEAGDLLDAVLGERADSSVIVTVDRYIEGRASVKMQGHAFGDMTREAYRIGRKWELIDQEHGIVFFTIRAGSLQKAVKAWAKKLNTHAERIDVARSF